VPSVPNLCLYFQVQLGSSQGQAAHGNGFRLLKRNKKRPVKNIQMKFENHNGVSALSDVNHNDHKKMTGRMAYITVTENAVKWWITVQGLNHREV
jgi:hypothetical protein